MKRIFRLLRLPLEFTGEQLLDSLMWPKAHKVLKVSHEGFLVATWTKEEYLQRFESEQSKYIIPHDIYLWREDEHGREYMIAGELVEGDYGGESLV